MKLITEEIEQAEYIVEETDGKKNYAIKGIFMQSDIKNKNGRMYPKEILPVSYTHLTLPTTTIV